MGTGLFDVAHRGENVLVRCACGHREVLEGGALECLFRLQRWNAELAQLGRHLRCGRCRRKDLMVEATSQPHTKVVGPASEYEWRLLKRRLRD